MLIIGIDPGISGAICFFEDGQVKEIIDMPVMADGKKNKRQDNCEKKQETEDNKTTQIILNTKRRLELLNIPHLGFRTRMTSSNCRFFQLVSFLQYIFLIVSV